MLALGLMVFGLAFAEGSTPPDCTYDRPALLAEGLKAFDQDLHGGWRPLADKGCLREAADLIAAWRAAHPDLSAEQAMGIAWHEGQMRAAFGDNAGAIADLSLSLKKPEPEMRDYVAATIAFLKHDRPGLLAARAALVAEPKPDGFDAAAADARAHGDVVTWPLNLDKVDGLIACFDKPYKEAYGCRPSGAHEGQ